MKLRQALVDWFAYHQTTNLEIFAACVTSAYGFALVVSVAPLLQRLLGAVPTQLVGLVFSVVGLSWLSLIRHAVLTKRVQPAKYAALAGAICWLYLSFDIFALVGGTAIWVLFSIFYLGFTLAAVVCYLRCDIVAAAPSRDEDARA